METPPESVLTLLECLAILKSLKDTNSWKNLSDMIEDINFLNNLQELDMNKINQRQQTQVRTKIKFFKKSTDIQTLTKVECSLLKFIESVLKYCTIYQDVLPLKNKIDKFEKDYLDATLKLREHENSLNNTRFTLSNLEKSFDNITKENAELQIENGLLKIKFEYADKLMLGLISVHKRYKNNSRLKLKLNINFKLINFICFII